MKVINTLWKVGLVAAFLTSASFTHAAPVNVNTADAQTLAVNVNGIGPKKAQAIIDYRNQNGPFKSAADLAKVKGIGQKIVDKNKADLLFSNTAAGKDIKSAKN